ncbi:MAG: hypothetical protein K6V97_07175 [Actinomycetia bacterium]|nr:hypothetical protein [Actinomycetes bacterium]
MGRGDQPAVGVSAAGAPWLAWVAPQGTLRVGRRDPGGWMVRELPPPASGRVAAPVLAPLPGGDMVVAWQESAPAGSRVRLARLRP